ncbi:MAG: PH domain-containing protein [Oscillospiraceae bacterium]|nr:PH domain-containing protein [Oscillospiraceae bacterium]
MKFKAKVDWWIHLTFAVLVAVNIWALVNIVNWGVTGIILAATFTPINVFTLPIWLNSYYLVERGELIVRSGFLTMGRIEVGQITSIGRTWNPISSPALSLDRTEVRYKYKSGNYHDTLLIAPKDRDGFIAHLKSINESIEVAEGRTPVSKGTKMLLIVVGGISAITLLGVGVMFLVGEAEPAVTIHSDHIQIRSMYGTSVPFGNITEITLIDQSMREIGAGRRTNGYAAAAWKGHFSVGLLFVRPDSSPTIRIERSLGSAIFISFRDNARTVDVYGELTLALSAP